MTKNQHYVPQFYLKRFSAHIDKKQINLFNMNRKLFVKNASIKGQASKAFFYGKDGKIEVELSRLEYKASLILKALDRGEVLDAENEAVLYFFISVGHMRTDSMAKKTNESLAFMSNSISELNKTKLKRGIDEQVYNFDCTPAYNIINAKDIARNISDLKMCMINNETKLDFITSDSPVFIHNNFWEDLGYKRGIRGVASPGTIIMLPVSSRLLIVLYDGDVYEDIGNLFKIKNKDVVSVINRLQILHAMENIYYENDAQEKYINKISEEMLFLRKNNTPSFQVAAKVDTGNKGSESFVVLNSSVDIPESKSYLLITNQSPLHTNYRIVFLRTKKKPSYVRINDFLIRHHCNAIKEKF